MSLIFCAIDTPNAERALALAAAMQKAGCGIKLGLEFFNAQGPQGIAEIRRAYQDLPLFLDLKYHDIPNTVAGAIRAAARLAPDFINVHASGGRAMMEAARDALDEATAQYGIQRPKLLAVTILTSLEQDALQAVGYQGRVQDNVERLARLTRESGLDGVVCSPLEIEPVRMVCGDDFITMVPGIRPESAEQNDQKRIMTPHQAMQAGATHLVIGRPITGAADPAAAARAIIDNIETHRIAGMDAARAGS